MAPVARLPTAWAWITTAGDSKNVGIMHRRPFPVDPSVVDAFLAVVKKDGFWEVLERNLFRDSLLEMRVDIITESLTALVLLPSSDLPSVLSCTYINEPQS